jgi:uncharacterized delta-60 repeat protein
MFPHQQARSPGRSASGRGRRPGAVRAGAESLEPRRLLSAGDLDPSFNGTGQATVDFGPGASAFAVAPAVQADGRTVVAGYVAGPAGKHIAVARFNVDGTLDRSFGPDHSGKVVTPVDHSSYANDLALQDDGKIVVVGRGDTDGVDGHMVVVRYNTDGTLDATFDGNGMKAIDFPDDNSWATSVAIQAGGKILVGGGAANGNIITSNDDFALARLNPDGSFDGSFDGDGKRLIGFGFNEQVLSIATDYNGTPATNPHYGKIIAVGGTDAITPSLVVARLNDDGSLDNTFDHDGQLSFRYATANTLPAGLVLQDGGRIVIGANLNDNTMAMVRLSPDGQLDPSFGTGGSGWQIVVLGGAERASDLIATPDGKLYLGGTLDGATIVAPHTPDGHPDAVFGIDGYTRAPFGGARRMAYGPGRRFVMASGAQFRTARFLDDGANVVRVSPLFDTVAHEQGQDPASFFVYRSEKLPYPTRVFLDVGGTATPSSLRNFRFRDYTADGIVFPDEILGDGGPPYVDIPANQTFALVVLTPVQDTRVEGTETMFFTVRPDPNGAYEVGSPTSTELTLLDDDVALNGAVAGRYAFYNNSKYDGNDPAAGAADDAAIAADKVAALPNQPLTRANVTSYSRGLNGIILDMTGLPAGPGPTATDFSFQGGTDANEANWPDVPGPTSVLVRRGAGAGGADRVTLAWDGAAAAVKNAWLRVTVRANLTTGLASPDVFYFGNLSGDTGDGTTTFRVNALDLGAVKSALNTNSDITGRLDFNRDGRVNALDLGAVKSNLNRSLPVPGAAPTAPAAVAFSVNSIANLAGSDDLRVWDAREPDLLG